MFWGEQDASVFFCEDKYVESQYIAEYNNTWSCIFYLVPAIIYHKTNLNNISVCLFFLAIGSSLLHGTLRYYGQWLDEISMLCLSFMTIKEFKKGLPYDFLIIIIGLYLYLWNTFCIFLITFTAMQLIIVKESRRNIKKENKIYVNLYICSFLIGLACWLLDQLACSYVKAYNLHAWWHFFTSASMTSGYRVLLNKK